MKSVFVNGVTMHYEEMGAGRPVVLVHGMRFGITCLNYSRFSEGG